MAKKRLINGYIIDSMVSTENGSFIPSGDANCCDGSVEETEFELWFDEDTGKEVVVDHLMKIVD